jgi:hypothetical protein
VLQFNLGDFCTSYKIIKIWEQVVHFIPEDLGKLFPILEVLTIYKSNLKKVEKKDFQQLPKLTVINLHLNEIEFLPGDLFEANPELWAIRISSNQISHVSHNLVTPLEKLQYACLDGNKCIGKGYDQSQIASLAADLRAKCPEPQETIRFAAAIDFAEVQKSLQEIIKTSTTQTMSTTQQNDVKP